MTDQDAPDRVLQLRCAADVAHHCGALLGTVERVGDDLWFWPGDEARRGLDEIRSLILTPSATVDGPEVEQAQQVTADTPLMVHCPRPEHGAIYVAGAAIVDKMAALDRDGGKWVLLITRPD